jgi:two-component system response regulator YesN
MENIRPLIENDFIFSAVSNGQPEDQRQMLSFLGLEGNSGICLIVSEYSGSNHPYILLKKLLEEVGNKLLGGFFNNHSILYLMNKDPIKDSALDSICDYIKINLRNSGYDDFHIGVSDPVTNDNWSTAYKQARTALKYAQETNLLVKKYDAAVMVCSAGMFPPGKFPGHPEKELTDSSRLAAWSGLLTRAILDNREEQLKNLVVEICLMLVSGTEFTTAREEAYKLIILLEQELLKNLSSLELKLETNAAVLEAKEPRHLEMYLLSYTKQLSFLVHEIWDQSKNDFVDRAIIYIQTNYQKEISLSSIAKEINISPFYLSKLFRKHTGKTCTEIITDERIEAAKRFLMQNYSSKETCYQVGFNSQNYFAKTFKKYTGITPSEYRNTVPSSETK